MSAPQENGLLRHYGWSLRLLGVTKILALLGGALFMGMVALSVLSIIGRKLWSAPIHGDLELLQMGTGVAAATFFPYCTMMGEHLRVDFFTANLPERGREMLDGLSNFLFAATMALLAWRSASQAHELYEAGEVTVMRNIPVWIPVACLVPSLTLASLCGLNRSIRHFLARSIAP